MADQPMQSDAGQQVKDTAQQLAQQARDKSGDVMQKTQDTARQMAQEQKGRAAGSVSSVADALRQTGDNLENSDQHTFARYAHQAADQLDQFSNDLQNKSVDEIFGDVQDFARREPQLFLGGAFVLGLFAARFLKSSSPQPQGRYGQYAQGRSYYRQGDFGRPGDYRGVQAGSGYERRYSNRYDQPGYEAPGTGQFAEPGPFPGQAANPYPARRPDTELPYEPDEDVPPYPGRMEGTGE